MYNVNKLPPYVPYVYVYKKACGNFFCGERQADFKYGSINGIDINTPENEIKEIVADIYIKLSKQVDCCIGIYTTRDILNNRIIIIVQWGYTDKVIDTGTIFTHKAFNNRESTLEYVDRILKEIEEMQLKSKSNEKI